MNNDAFDKFLSRALERKAAAPSDEAAAARVLKRLAGPLPRQKQPLWRLPAVLLDWQFAPAWPRVAALAACLMLGFGIGIAGLDRPLDRIDGVSASGNDLSSAVFEAEALTGARP
jgi:hypothetical protein